MEIGKEIQIINHEWNMEIGNKNLKISTLSNHGTLSD